MLSCKSSAGKSSTQSEAVNEIHPASLKTSFDKNTMKYYLMLNEVWEQYLMIVFV